MTKYRRLTKSECRGLGLSGKYKFYTTEPERTEGFDIVKVFSWRALRTLLVDEEVERRKHATMSPKMSDRFSDDSRPKRRGPTAGRKLGPRGEFNKDGTLRKKPGVREGYYKRKVDGHWKYFPVEETTEKNVPEVPEPVINPETVSMPFRTMAPPVNSPMAQLSAKVESALSAIQILTKRLEDTQPAPTVQKPVGEDQGLKAFEAITKRLDDLELQSHGNSAGAYRMLLQFVRQQCLQFSEFRSPEARMLTRTLIEKIDEVAPEIAQIRKKIA